MSKIKSAEELRKKIRQEFFSYEDDFIKEGMDNTMLHIEEYLKAKLESITDDIPDFLYRDKDGLYFKYREDCDVSVHWNEWLKQKLLKDE